MSKQDDQAYLIEMTDTMGGDPNYSWVGRYKVRAKTLAAAVRKFSKYHGFQGRVRFEYEILDVLGTRRYRLSRAAVCFFACDWSDEHHQHLMHVRDLS